MQLTRITAIRHGETEWNAARRVQGHTDIGLSAAGREQAARVARALAGGERIAAIYSSDLARAFETAAAIGAAVGVAVQPEPGLRERNFGRAEGLTFDEFSRRWPEDAERWRKRDPHWSSDGGESLQQLWERITGVAHRLGVQHLGQHIVVVTHGGVLDALYRAATGLGLQDARTWQLGNCAINRLLWTPDSGLSLIGWADDGHLEQSAADDRFPDPPPEPDRWAALWNRAWQTLGLPAPAALLPRLLACYAEPRRHYHTAQHLGECLTHLERVWAQAERPGEIALALWFHDAIYDVHAPDNEAQSAAWARRALQEAGAPDDVAGRVHALVMATRHDAPPQGGDARLLVDIDLAILGAAPERFAEYEQQIRAEYAHVPAAVFNARRRALLADFLARQPLYLTPHFHAELEAQARANLQTALARLGDFPVHHGTGGLAAGLTGLSNKAMLAAADQ